MPTQDYIDAHELTLAYNAVCCSRAGFEEWAILADYDVDPLDDDAEARIAEIISDQAASEWASAERRAAA